MLGIFNDIVFFTTRKTLEFNGKNVKFEGDCMSQLMTTQPLMSVNINKWNGTDKDYIKEDT